MLKTMVDVEPGDELTFEFEAEADWALTCDRQWIKFWDEELGKENASLEGFAGSFTVTVIVTADAQSFEGDKAVVEMTMAGETRTVAEISRSAKERSAKMFMLVNADDIIAAELVDIPYLDREDYVRVGFEANFDWKFVSAPEWVNTRPAGYKSIEDVNGDAGQEISVDGFGAFVVRNVAKYADQTGKIVIGEKDGDRTFEFEVRAAGIPAEKILWEDLKIARSGFTWNCLGKLGDGEDADKPAELRFVVKDMEYELLYLDAKGNPLTEANRSWITVEDDKNGCLKITARQNEDGGDERAVYLGVMPKGVDMGTYVKVENRWYTLKNLIFPSSGYAFNPTYPFVVALRQEETPGGFKIVNQNTYKEWVKASRADNAAEIASALKLNAADNIWQYRFSEAEWSGSSAVNFGIMPKGYDSEDFGSFRFYDSSYREIVSTEGVLDIPGWAAKYDVQPRSLDYQIHFGIKLMKADRVAFANLPDSDLIIVCYDDKGAEIGTFVIKKK